MKLLIKFLSLGVISILCIILLGYHSSNSLNQYSEFTKKLRDNNELFHIYSERIMITNSINKDVWNAIDFSKTGNEEQIENISNNLNKYSEKDYYQSNKNIPNTTKLNFANYISAAKKVITTLKDSSLQNNINKYETAFTTINNENNLLYKQTERLNNKFIEDEELLLEEHFQGNIVITSIAVLLSLLASLFSYVNIFNPLSTIINIMTSDRTKEIPFSSREDEIGDIARAAEMLRLTSMEKNKIEEESKQQIQKSEEDRKISMLSFSHNFETKVKDIVDMVALSIEKMNVTSKELEKLAEDTQKETTLLSSTSLQTNSSIKEVSKATNEYTVSADEINTQINKSLEYSRKAGEQTDNVNKVVLELEEKANAVSGIIDIINNITSQIDLLALNATIEAARAGDMGKGFAVVANEVKALATQTSKATEQINFQISGIQSSTDKAVVSIQEITESVKTINNNSERITSAVKKQSSTSSFIANSISEVASKFDSVSNGVKKVAESSNHYGNAATQIVSATSDLSKQSGMLQEEVDKFLSSLKLT